MANEYTEIRAPYPNHKVTILLPKPLFGDSRATEARVTVKRLKDGTKVVYRDSNARETLVLPFRLTRMKAIEVERFLAVYQGAPMQLDLYDGTQWEAKLTGVGYQRVTENRRDDQLTVTGGESVNLTLTFSALRLN